MRRAWADIEYNNACPDEIIDDDKVYNRDDMYKYFEEKHWND